MSTTKSHSTCRIANIGPDDAMILAQAANPDGSNFRKGQGVAGHYTVHHGLLGAAAGCIIGRHEARKRAQIERAKKEHPTPDNGEERL